MTIQLTCCRRVGALIIGTVVAVMRVSPVAGAAGLRHLVREHRPEHPADPDRLLLRLRALQHAGHHAGRQDSPTFIVDNNFRFGGDRLAVYHAAFVAEAIRSGINTVPVGQAEAARAIGLSFLPDLRPTSCCRRRSAGRSRRWATC